jgi:hypothetical protein
MNTKFFKECIVNRQIKNDLMCIVKLKDESLAYLTNWFLGLESFFWIDKKLLRAFDQDIHENSEILYNSLKAIDYTLKVLGEYQDTVKDFIEDLKIFNLSDKPEDYDKLGSFFKNLESIIPKYYHFNHAKQVHFTGVPTLDNITFSPSIKPVYDFNFLTEEKESNNKPQKIINYISVALIRLSISTSENTEISFQIDLRSLDNLIKDLQQLQANMVGLESVVKDLKAKLS